MNPLKDLSKERQPRERSFGALTGKGSFPAFRKIGPSSGWAALRRRPRISSLAPRPAPLRTTQRGGLGGSGLGLRRAELGKIITKSQADGRVRGFPSPVPTTYPLNFNRDLLRNGSSGRLSNSRCDGDAYGVRTVLVFRCGTTGHHAIHNRDARTIRGRVRPVR